jgi:uncharacterized protein YbaR (Trm112 family)
MYAEEDQVGQSLTCPDCRRSVIVPPAPMRDPTPPPVIPALLDDHYRVNPGVDQPPAGSITSQKHFAVVCPLCHTRMSATEEQIGQTLTCPDCGRAVKVRPPPASKPVRRWSEDDGVEIPIAATFQRPMIVVPLHESSVAEAKVKRSVINAPQLPRWPLVSGVFTFPAYGTVLPYWMGYGVWLGVLLWLLHFIVSMIVVNSLILIAVVFLINAFVVFFGLWWLATSSVFLAVVQDTSEGLDRVENWPGSLILGSEYRDPIFTLNAAGLAAAPGGALAAALGAAGFGWPVVPLGVALLFPLFLLSMMENDSPMMPISRPVWRGAKKARSAWLAFYVETTAVLGGAGGIAWYAWRQGDLLNLVGAGIAVVAALFIYYRLLGRLAWITALQPDEESDDEDNQDEDHAERPLVAQA